MIKELFQQTVKETALHISQSKIEAVMKKNITKSGCRVYKDGVIGIAGSLGQASAATWAEAEANLARNIPYPFEPEKNKKRVRDLRSLAISEQEFVREMEDLLQELHRRHPAFIYSNKIKLIETEVVLRNDAGLDLANLDRTIEIALLIKHVESVNIFDTAFVYAGRKMERERICNEVAEMLSQYTQPAELPGKKKMPVVIHQGSLLSKVTESLNAETVGRGTSLFSDKIGKKVFADHFSVYQDATEEKYHTPFFDMEGVFNPGDQILLIEKGLIRRPYADKKQAETFSLEGSTGAAGGGYDDVPSLGYPDLSVVPSQRTLKELLRGDCGILVIMASGGDYTHEGNFASPVQMSYLTDGERLLGKLPELNITGNLYDLFGADFVGVSQDKPFMGERFLVVNMEISS